MESITASPLCWPVHQARTQSDKRVDGRFGRREVYRRTLTLHQARRRVIEELERFTRVGREYRVNPADVIVSSQLELRKDGLPRSGQKQPTDPGVAVYFELDGVSRCLACDQYTKIEQNLAAIAATLSALRTIERHGSQLFEAAFTGFNALPGPDHVVGRSWRDVLDYYGNDSEEARQAYLRKRAEAHPDKGGTKEEFNAVLNAWDEALTELVVKNE